MPHFLTRTVLLAAFVLLATFSLRAAELPFTVKVTGKGSPVILIPGYTCGGGVWDSTVAHFQSTRQCHVLTIRGFGGVAAAQKPFTLREVKDGIKTYITENKLKHVIIAGHSMGGFLAMWVAAEMQKPQLAGIVIVDAVPFLAALADSTATAKGIDTAAAAKMEAMISSQPYEMRKQYAKGVAVYNCLDSTFHPQIMEWSATADAHTSVMLLMEMAGTDLRQTIASIKVPVLALTAWEPGYGVPQQSIAARWTAQFAAVPEFTLRVITPSRHFIMYDAPEVLYREMNTFMAQHVPAGK
ncbi:MAG: alpha/beta hydrolase [Bacteroidia bacterium]|jgi:pimeloyl-ACP methyl ester carboxylesterase|nr:alpha/beta hydrolase [Bacteroidia bacterium]